MELKVCVFSFNASSVASLTVIGLFVFNILLCLGFVLFMHCSMLGYFEKINIPLRKKPISNNCNGPAWNSGVPPSEAVVPPCGHFVSTFDTFLGTNRISKSSGSLMWLPRTDPAAQLSHAVPGHSTRNATVLVCQNWDPDSQVIAPS